MSEKIDWDAYEKEAIEEEKQLLIKQLLESREKEQNRIFLFNLIYPFISLGLFILIAIIICSFK